MSKLIDIDLLTYFWSKVSPKIDAKVDKDGSKVLSDNNYTTAEKEKLSGIATGANKTTVENVLTSTSSTNALAAAQGKVLDEKIKALSDSMGELGYGDMMKATYDADNDGKVDNAAAADDAAKLGGQAPSYYAKAADIPDISGKLDKTGDGSNVTATFTAATSRTNITTGEKLSAIFAKIAKYFADLKTVAFTGSYDDLTNKPSIPTVTNDLTDALKSNYDAAYTHSQAAHAPSNAQANVIESIKVNGTALTPNAKAVNITVPTTVASLTDAGNYALKSDLSSVYKYIGSVATYSALPSTGVTVGSVYNVQDTGMNYAWDGTAWDTLGMSLELNLASTGDIDGIFE